MFTVIYRWQVKEGCEERFREAWRRATAAIVDSYDSRGSRLHRADDGSFLAYAQWSSRADWEAMQSGPPADEAAFATMRDCLQASTETICLTVLDDLLRN